MTAAPPLRTLLAENIQNVYLALLSLICIVLIQRLLASRAKGGALHDVGLQNVVPMLREQSRDMLQAIQTKWEGAFAVTDPVTFGYRGSVRNETLVTAVRSVGSFQPSVWTVGPGSIGGHIQSGLCVMWLPPRVWKLVSTMQSTVQTVKVSTLFAVVNTRYNSVRLTAN